MLLYPKIILTLLYGNGLVFLEGGWFKIPYRRLRIIILNAYIFQYNIVF